MNRTFRSISLLFALGALGLLAFAVSAQAATLNLKCSGTGPQNKAQEYETASCAVAAGQKRNIEGVLRNDKNKPVAGTLKVTFSKWIPQGDSSYSITPEKTIEVKAAASGKFKVPNVTTKTEETVYIEAIGDADSELSTVTQEVNIQRYVTATAQKLGGGKVKVTVQGAAPPFKVAITDESGYYVSGGSPRKASKAGAAVFNLHGARGTYNIYVDAGELGDLYYLDAKPFKL
jgi:hypothetical protein